MQAIHTHTHTHTHTRTHTGTNNTHTHTHTNITSLDDNYAHFVLLSADTHNNDTFRGWWAKTKESLADTHTHLLARIDRPLRYIPITNNYLPLCCVSQLLFVSKGADIQSIRYGKSNVQRLKAT